MTLKNKNNEPVKVKLNQSLESQENILTILHCFTFEMFLFCNPNFTSSHDNIVFLQDVYLE